MPDPITPDAQASPDQPTQAWPEAFTPEDIRLMQSLDSALQNIVLEAAQSVAHIAWVQRTVVLDALLKLRTGTRLN